MTARIVEVESCCKTLMLQQQLIGDVSCVVWDAAIVLSKYLQRLTKENGENLLAGCHVLELGSGVGCVGLTAATLGAEAVLTDLPDALTLLKQNITNNKATIVSQGGFASAELLTWGDVDSDIIKNLVFDYVFLADCVYYEESINPLIKTLQEINQSSGKKAQIFICQELRDTEIQQNFWKVFYEKLMRCFDVTQIDKNEQHPEYCSDDIIILKCTKKASSHGHTIL